MLRAYDFTGAPLGMEINISGATNYMGVGQFQVVDDMAYYYSDSTQQVYRSSVGGGASTPLAFLPSGFSISFAVSLDGSKIAWATNDWDVSESAPFSTMWTANIDGSNVQEVANISAAGNQEKFLVLMPLQWTEDGQLLYSTNITGIGGYILFWGFNSLLMYNPASGASTTLVGEDYGICLNDVSANLALAGAGCGSNVTDGVEIIQINSGVKVDLPILPDQSQSGSVRFSPDNQKVAYAVARSQYDDEYGQVAVAPVDGSSAPLVIAAYGVGYYHVIDWIDDDTILIERYEFGGATEQINLWLVNSDGSGLVRIGNGYWRGFVNNP
jgi:hypothetical protein